jgi:hypothetical protein
MCMLPLLTELHKPNKLSTNLKLSFISSLIEIALFLAADHQHLGKSSLSTLIAVLARFV